MKEVFFGFGGAGLLTFDFGLGDGRGEAGRRMVDAGLLAAAADGALAAAVAEGAAVAVGTVDAAALLAGSLGAG